MSKVKDLLKELGDELRILFARYRDYEVELIPFQGRIINEKDLPDLTRIINGMQDTFAQLHPVYNYIVAQNHHALTMIENHTKFIQAIKEGGASYDVTPEAREKAGRPIPQPQKSVIYMGEA